MKHSIFLDLMRRKQTSDAKKRMKQLAEDYGCKKIYDLNYCGDHNRNHLCDLYYPAGSEKKKLPVILEVHGGGFVTGSNLY